jgi:hypothetical protein
MADDDQNQEEDDQGQDLVPRSHIRQLEAQAKEAKELKERLTSMERENAFAKAIGTGTGEPWFEYFQAGYKGELTTEAIRQAVTDAGFAKAPAETIPPPSADNPADLAAHQRLAQAQAGAAPPPPFDPAAEIAKATSQEEVLAIIARCDPDKYGVTGPIVT